MTEFRFYNIINYEGAHAQREASQPAYDFRFRAPFGHPSGALEDGARGKFFLECPYMFFFGFETNVT